MDNIKAFAEQFLKGHKVELSEDAQCYLRTALMRAYVENPEHTVLTASHLRQVEKYERLLSGDFEACDKEVAKSAILHALSKTNGQITSGRIGAWSRSWQKIDEVTRKEAIEELTLEGKIDVSEGRGDSVVITFATGVTQ